MKTKIKIKFLELIRPGKHTYLEYPLHIQFEVFRWMLATGLNYRNPGEWGSSGVFELLFGLSCTNAQHYPRSHSVGGEPEVFLRDAFARALLSKGNSAVDRWREDHGIQVYGERWVKMIYDSADLSCEFERDLRRLLVEHPDEMAKSPNRCWSNARHVHSVYLWCVLGKAVWQCSMSYGIRGESSSWDLDIATQKPDEDFSGFIRRAGFALCRACGWMTEFLPVDPSEKVLPKW